VNLEPLYHQSFGQGPDLVFLHGFLGSGDNFWPHAQALKDRYRCWLLDLPGHGRSPHIPSYTMTSLAEGVLRTLESLQLGPLRVVGHSLGGKVAARMAQLKPAALSHVVMADITPAPTEPKHAAILQAMRSLPLASLAKRDDAEPYLREAEPVMDVRRFLLKNLAAKAGGGWEWKPDIAGFERDERNLLLQTFDGPPFLGPALLIRALRSDYVSDADVLVAKKVFPNLTVKTMESGHWLHAEKPGEFVELLRDFLR
jgi:esterase